MEKGNCFVAAAAWRTGELDGAIIERIKEENSIVFAGHHEQPSMIGETDFRVLEYGEALAEEGVALRESPETIALSIVD